MASVRTTIMFPEELKDKVHSSGVRNFSAYLVGLTKGDLSLVDKRVESSDDRNTVLNKRLSRVEKEWFAFMRFRLKEGDKRFDYSGGVIYA